jgi:hypothetical protein
MIRRHVSSLAVAVVVLTIPGRLWAQAAPAARGVRSIRNLQRIEVVRLRQ